MRKIKGLFIILFSLSMMVSCSTSDNKDGISLDIDQRNENVEVLVNRYKYYLDQYHASINKLQSDQLEKKARKEDEERDCRVFIDLFRDIPLPPPPRVKDESKNAAIRVLINHIKELRELIRQNNRYVVAMRMKYTDCAE